jgi:NAD(P)H-flavin reductase
LETQRWPRVWRHFSLANAPRPDNTLTLQVRAVPGGWVSSALVNHTRIGDSIRMGPPVGTMLCNTASARDVLCIAGGTGLAPIKSIIEDMASWNTNRQVRLFFGGRRPEDLYDTADLNLLAERCPWLSLVTVASHDPRYVGERGILADVVARHGEFHEHWNHHDVYVCGSPSMVRSTIGRLQELDIPLSQIRFDAYGETADIWQSTDPAARSRQASQASKSSSTADVNGLDWQASTKPSAFSSGSKA